MWKLNVMFLKVGKVACSAFHFRYSEHSRGFFHDVMLALRCLREQARLQSDAENSFYYLLSHVLEKKKTSVVPLQWRQCEALLCCFFKISCPLCASK